MSELQKVKFDGVGLSIVRSPTPPLNENVLWIATEDNTEDVRVNVNGVWRELVSTELNTVDSLIVSSLFSANSNNERNHDDFVLTQDQIQEVLLFLTGIVRKNVYSSSIYSGLLNSYVDRLFATFLSTTQNTIFTSRNFTGRDLFNSTTRLNIVPGAITGEKIRGQIRKQKISSSLLWSSNMRTTDLENLFVMSRDEGEAFVDRWMQDSFNTFSTQRPLRTNLLKDGVDDPSLLNAIAEGFVSWLEGQNLSSIFFPDGSFSSSNYELWSGGFTGEPLDRIGRGSIRREHLSHLMENVEQVKGMSGGTAYAITLRALRETIRDIVDTLGYSEATTDFPVRPLVRAIINSVVFASQLSSNIFTFSSRFKFSLNSFSGIRFDGSDSQEGGKIKDNQINRRMVSRVTRRSFSPPPEPYSYSGRVLPTPNSNEKNIFVYTREDDSLGNALDTYENSYVAGETIYLFKISITNLCTDTSVGDYHEFFLEMRKLATPVSVSYGQGVFASIPDSIPVVVRTGSRNTSIAMYLFGVTGENISGYLTTTGTSRIQVRLFELSLPLFSLPGQRSGPFSCAYLWSVNVLKSPASNGILLPNRPVNISV